MPAKKFSKKKVVSARGGSPPAEIRRAGSSGGKKAPKKVSLKPVGRVTHFFGGIGVAIVKFGKPVKVGTEVNFRGATTDFSQKISSMQFDHKEIKSAVKGKEVGIKVKNKVRDGDEIFLVN